MRPSQAAWLLAAVLGAAAMTADAEAGAGEESGAPASPVSAMTWGVGGAYYEDSDRNRRHDESLWAKLPLEAFSLAAEGVSHAAHDSLGNPDSQQLLVGVDTKLPGDIVHDVALELRIGVLRFDGDVDPAGRVAAKRKGDWGEADAVIEYAALAETAEMIRNHVTYAGLEVGGKAAIHERFRPGLRVRLRDYSDDNRSIRVRGDLPGAIFIAPVRWELGYRQEYASFERQSGSGYFDPSQLNSFQAVTSLAWGGSRFEGYGEFFGGLQTSRRYGNDNSDGFYGLYAEAAVNHVGPFRIAVTVEGGDYSLNTAGGFRHIQAGLVVSSGAGHGGGAAE